MVRFSVDRPRLVTALMVIAALVLAAFMPRVKIDTDPENMLSKDDPVRVFHNRMKEEFAVHDMIVVGLVNEEHEDGVFNPGSLRKVYALTEYAKQLRGEKLEAGAIDMEAVLADAGLAEGAEPQSEEEATEEASAPETPTAPTGAEPALPDMGAGAADEEPALPAMGGEEEPEEPPLPTTGGEPAGPQQPPAPPPGPEKAEERVTRGVVVIDLLAPSTVDRIEHAGENTINFSYLMKKPLPSTRSEALEVREGALNNPLLNGTVVSGDGEAVAIYLPITHKNISYKVSRRLEEFIDRLGGPEDYHITGLPVAEDTFGHEMFVQMAISAPLAMLVIFILMFVFFRKLVLIISPMIVALVSVICTMGLLIGLGYTVHIMSSMIPIFIMPIAVLDAIHILSEFFDRYQATRNRRETVLKVMDELFVPMLYTSLTSAAGFASLALTPIPPVQVFGVFVAFGIMLAWLLTVTFVPAYIMFIPESRLENFGVSHAEEAPDTALTRLLRGIGRFTVRRGKLIVTLTLVVIAVAVYGITRIRINDNPTKWFVKDHPIRVADRVLNRHFAGTYQAYLALEPQLEQQSVADVAEAVRGRIAEARDDYAEDYPDEPGAEVFEAARQIAQGRAADSDDIESFLEAVLTEAEQRREAAEGDDVYAWEEVIAAVEVEKLALEQPFKRPDVVRYIASLQQALVAEPDAPAASEPVVGKSNSLADIVKKVHKELRGDEQYYSVPDDRRMVAECLLQFQNSHTPDDLWHFVTPDYKKGNVWVQLRSGDNRDMERVVAKVERYVEDNPPPVPMEQKWFGLTYINVVWQDKMVVGMLQAFMGSFLVVFILMTVLFHSALWGLLSMIPLTVTIALIYGLIGLVGKDYDMPVAVLSSLTLGLAVDFAIHFLARSRAAMREVDSWREAVGHIFGEPARAISRNAIVVAVGFLPLLAAPLIPYKTVGMFMAGILAVAGVATLLILPVLVNALGERLFARLDVTRVTCNCIACIAASVAAVLLLALNFHQYFRMGWSTLTWVSVVLIPLLVFVCGFMSRRRECKMMEQQNEQGGESNENG
ncbi:MAG: MMPL family transporter [Candidatus Brocadiia bacterium]